MRLISAILPLACAAAIAGAESTVRIDVDATNESVRMEGGRILPGAPGSAETAVWISDEAKRACYLVAEFTTPSKTWTEVAFSFTPAASCNALLSLKGPWRRKANSTTELEQVFATFDDIRIEGSSVYNGGFEEASEVKGQFAKGWFPGGNADYPKLIETAGAAKEGTKAVATWLHGSINQTITLKAGVPVTIRAWVWSDAPAAAAPAAH